MIFNSRNATWTGGVRVYKRKDQSYDKVLLENVSDALNLLRWSCPALPSAEWKWNKLTFLIIKLYSTEKSSRKGGANLLESIMSESPVNAHLFTILFFWFLGSVLSIHWHTNLILFHFINRIALNSTAKKQKLDPTFMLYANGSLPFLLHGPLKLKKISTDPLSAN